MHVFLSFLLLVGSKIKPTETNKKYSASFTSELLNVSIWCVVLGSTMNHDSSHVKRWNKKKELIDDEKPLRAGGNSRVG